jgi:hypothetical protein
VNSSCVCPTTGAIPTRHSNGLGQYFVDCDPSYAPTAWTQAAAVLAADAWISGTTTTTGVSCGPDCVEKDAGSNGCAVWCYFPSFDAGHVASSTQGCANACPTLTSPSWYNAP